MGEPAMVSNCKKTTGITTLKRDQINDAKHQKSCTEIYSIRDAKTGVSCKDPNCRNVIGHLFSVGCINHA
jgi:hypothetical protein